LGSLVDRGRAVEIAKGSIESRPAARSKRIIEGGPGIQVFFNGFIRPVMSDALSISRHLAAGELDL
jgi:hypothetical protein